MTACFNRWMPALLIALVAVGMSFGSAAAAPATPADGNTKAERTLTRTYKAQQHRLKLQDARLRRAADYAAKIDQLIVKLSAKGQDTTALGQAVAAFRSSITQARTEWQAASASLATHAGFDGTGKVSNADQARATLKDAHGHLEQVHTIARAAYEKLHAAIADYRKAHRELKEPAAPPQP